MDSKLFGTEKINAAAIRSHALSPLEVLTAINAEDAQVAGAVAKAIPAIETLVAKTIAQMKQGGRLFYIGAGTSGRIGVLDASECPPTFGTDPDLVQGLIAGGDHALRNAAEGAEDDAAAGAQIANENLHENDVLVCISASGSAAYVQAAAQAAKARGIFTAAISTAPDSPLLGMVDCAILADTGAEFVAGSTRMKSGTAQKLIANMITTVVMIGLGKVYAGYMIDVKCSNQKLVQRAVKMLATLSGCGGERAADLIAETVQRTPSPVKPALVMFLENTSYEQAVDYLAQQGGHIDALMQKHGRDRALGCG